MLLGEKKKHIISARAYPNQAASWVFGGFKSTDMSKQSLTLHASENDRELLRFGDLVLGCGVAGTLEDICGVTFGGRA